MNLRNLEQIQENDGRGRPLPIATLLLSAIVGGALVVVAMTTFSRERPAQKSDADALDRLLAEQPAATPASELSADLVTFPGILSDGEDPTTALATVKNGRGQLLTREVEAPLRASPPDPAGDSSALPRTVLPAGDLLAATPVTKEPKDELTQITAERLADDPEGELAPPGQEGGYEIQVASFQSKTDAEGFVEELRKRGHSAYRQAAYVPERGLWHRVRIGGFKSKYQARNYQQKFEKSERLSTFLVDPDKMKRQKDIRDAKERAREAKKKRTVATAR